MESFSNIYLVMFRALLLISIPVIEIVIRINNPIKEMEGSKLNDPDNWGDQNAKITNEFNKKARLKQRVFSYSSIVVMLFMAG